jgi:hypothetical protein
LLVAVETTYRLVTAEEMALEPKVAGSRRWKPAVLLAVAACLVLTAWLGKQYIIGGNGPVFEIPVVPVPEFAARDALPVERGSPMVSAQVRAASAADPEGVVAARNPVVDDKIALKPVPDIVFPFVKDNNSEVRTSLAKVFPAPSYSKLFPDGRPRTFAEVPEIDLDQHLVPTALSNKADSLGAKYRISQKVDEIFRVIKDDPDAFVKQIKDRADLAGLPFIMGKECRLSTDLADTLRANSREIRMNLERTKQENSRGPYYKQSKDNGVRFWERTGGIFNLKTGIPPGLEQILLAESASHRMLFMKRLKELEGKAATRILAQRALFDLDGDVRETALEALKDRPPEHVEPFLLQGLRYPWPQAVHNAAEAIVKLNRTDLLSTLVDMLDQPDPDAPFVGGPIKNQAMVRELVRVNHHRNCLLCHAPVDVKDRRDRRNFSLPLGPIPVPGERMPTSAVVYYSPKSGQNVVRADVTYLRQDFSVMLPVAYADPWPAEQRYDFFVRVRALTHQEALSYKMRKPALETGHKTTIVLTLKALTGQDAGYSAAAWRRLLDPKLEKVWRSACNK